MTTETVLDDRLTPFFFGSTGKQLFGLYHSANPALERDFGVLICNPWGQEYVRAHRALMQMGLRLARQGFPVLRFDYYATGDSPGADEEGSLAQWQADIRAAIQELKRRARVESVFLIGLRLGATLAALVAAGREDVEGLALWEPAVTGAAYLRDLREWETEKQLYYLHETEASDPNAELLGFGLHPTLLDDIQGIDLLTARRKPAARVFLVENAITASAARPDLAALREHYAALGAKVEYAMLESFKMWTENPDKGLVPHQVLESIVTWITREVA